MYVDWRDFPGLPLVLFTFFGFQFKTVFDGRSPGIRS